MFFRRGRFRLVTTSFVLAAIVRVREFPVDRRCDKITADSEDGDAAMISYVDAASTSTSTRTTTSATTVPSSTPTRTSSTSTSLMKPRPCPEYVGHLRVRREDRNDYIDYDIYFDYGTERLHRLRNENDYFDSRTERLLPLLRLLPRRHENDYLDSK